MNKTELTEKVAESAGLTKVLAGKVLNSILVVITGALQVGNEVRFLGFGTFCTVKRAARTGRNPQNGKKIKIAAKTCVKFKPSKSLKSLTAKPFLVVAKAPVKVAAAKAPAKVAVAKAPAKVAAANARAKVAITKATTEIAAIIAAAKVPTVLVPTAKVQTAKVPAKTNS